jgi:hypothetical protein
MVLICAGALFLLQNLGLMSIVGGLIWGMLFGVAGLAFLLVFATSRANWWAAIPGLTLVGLAGLIGMGTVFPRMAERLGGPFFLGCIGLSFWVIYFTVRENWWAIIPAGTLSTLALIALLASESNGWAMGALLFLGLAATFGLIYLLPTPQGRMRWAIYPSGILGAMGMLLLIGAAGSLINIFLALALIGGGAYLVMRAVRTQETRDEH